MRVAAMVLLGGCWTATTTADQFTPRAATATTPGDSSREPEAGSRKSEAGGIYRGRYEAAHKQQIRAPLFADHSVWNGTYTCNQGVTGVTLSLDVTGRDVVAVFEFTAVASNPYVPSGASRLVGTLDAQSDGTYHLDLDPGEWISQPPGWFLVGIDASTIPGEREMHGSIKGSGCGAIDLERRN